MLESLLLGIAGIMAGGGDIYFDNATIAQETLNVIENRLVVQAEISDTEEHFDPFNDDKYDDPTTGLAPIIEPPKYISRSEWGADESLLTLKTHTKRGFFQRWFQTEEDLVPEKYRPRIVQTKNKLGELLFWPRAESPKIEKIVLHHTAEATSERDPMEIMRSIYYFHTITRGWGDIGYNFVIDKDGNIYEGRSGPPNTVGAHVAYHNIGSIGIALMGNFQIEKPTQRQMEVLEVLLAKLTYDYDIDPLGRSFFLEHNSQNITVHREVARHDHPTACAGKNLNELLPELREKVDYLKTELYYQTKSQSLMARDFLQKSADAPDMLKKPTKWERPEDLDEPLISFKKLLPKQIIKRNQRKIIDLEIKNGSEKVWKANSSLIIANVPEGMEVKDFRSLETVKPGETGIFRGSIFVTKTPNGLYNLVLNPLFLNESVFREKDLPILNISLQISGDASPKEYANNVYEKKDDPKPEFLKKLSATMFKSSAIEEPSVKVKLAFFNEKYAVVEANQNMTLREGNNIVHQFKTGERVKIISRFEPEKKRKYLEVSTEGEIWILSEATLQTEGVLRIVNYNRDLGHLEYNQFRKQLHFYPDGNLLVVNELPIEEYLWGLAEEPTTEPDAKKHAIHILARNYALVYSGPKRKFNTDLYDLEDDPKSSQFYLGYDWEKYHSEQKELIAETKGMVGTYRGQPVILPYFTQSSGHSSDQWQKQYPWTKSQPLPFDEGLEQRGHGVGLSGNTARELAKLGEDYEGIIKYFFDNIEIQKRY